MNKTPGQAAYETWQKEFPEAGKVTNPWSKVPKQVQDNWEQIAEAAVSQDAWNRYQV